MKKISIFLVALVLLIPGFVYARSDKLTVTLNKCIDGDTATFNYKNEEYKTRFLAVNTTELKKKEKYSKEALDFTCGELKKAKKIVLEFDPKSDEKDKYGRYLAWIFVDDKLLQEKLIENGLAEVKYIYGDYKYVDTLKEKEKIAKENKLNIWSIKKKQENKETKKEEIDYKYLLIYLAIIILLLLLGFTPAKIKKLKRTIKKL